MNDRVLYFPYIQVPDSAWFTRVLLYWDQVGAIIPYEFVNAPEQLGEHTRSLIEAELVTQVFPGAYVWNIPHFDTAFLQYIHSLKDLNRRRANFTRGKTSHIHAEKMRPISDQLMQLGLASEGPEYPWFLVESETASDFMCYLAAVLGRQKDVQLTPITDRPEHINHFLAASAGEKGIEGRLQHLRQDLLDDLLPSPTRSLNAYEIRRFKDGHGQQLVRFRRHVELELTVIADLTDPDLRDRHLILFRDGAREEIEEISARLRESGFGNIVLGRLCSVAAAIPGVHWIVGLAAAVYGAFRGGERGDDRSPLLYAAYAQRDLELSA